MATQIVRLGSNDKLLSDFYLLYPAPLNEAELAVEVTRPDERTGESMTS